jgi:putative DNA primase/helicase
MRQDFFEFVATHTLFLATNHRPVIRGSDHGIWRRILLWPFNVTLAQAEQDPDLLLKLTAELEGILSWAVKGYRKYIEKGLSPPNEVRVATADYRCEMDLIMRFINSSCEVDPQMRIQSSELYCMYREFCEKTGERPISQTSFSLRVSEHGFEKTKSAGRMVWQGIGVHQLLRDLRGGEGSTV